MTGFCADFVVPCQLQKRKSIVKVLDGAESFLSRLDVIVRDPHHWHAALMHLEAFRSISFQILYLGLLRNLC